MNKKLLALLLAALLVLSLAACGGGNGGGNARNPVADFLAENGNDIQEMVAPMAGAMGTDSRIDVEAGNGNEMIFTFVYGHDIPADMIDAELLEDALVGLDPLFTPLADALSEEMGIDTLQILVRYADSDGNILAERTFSN